MSINGHQLSGVSYGGVWSFRCPDWPDLTEKWEGDTITANAVADFTRRALRTAFLVRVLATGEKPRRELSGN